MVQGSGVIMTVSNQSSIRSPLSRARGLGSAKDGTHHFIMQRLSAVAIIPSAFYLIWNIRDFATTDLTDLGAVLSEHVNCFALIVFVASSYYHAMLGMQMIVEDYVHTPGRKMTLTAMNRIVFFFAAVASILAIFDTSIRG